MSWTASQHRLRRQTVLAAFQLILKHEAASRGQQEARRVSPSLFLWSAFALTGQHRAETLDGNLRADVAGEFLIDEATARHGITKEFALRRFDADANVCVLSEGDWLYFFGVEDEASMSQTADIADMNDDSEGAHDGIPAADLLLFRSVPLIHNSLPFLSAFLDARLQHVSQLSLLHSAEAEGRHEVLQQELAARDELQSTSRRRLYAAALRQRLAEDRLTAQQDAQLKSVRDESEKDTAELRKLKWEQEAVQKSIEATRDAAVRLEVCLQDTQHYITRCGDQFGVFKQYKNTLLELSVNEVRDEMIDVQGLAQRHHDKWAQRIDDLDALVTRTGRVLMLNSAAKTGRSRHAANLESCSTRYQQQHGEAIDFLWMLDNSRAESEPAAREATDEVIARWMLRDPTLFAPQSVLGPHSNLQLTKDSVSIAQRAFNRIMDSVPPAASHSNLSGSWMSLTTQLQAHDNDAKGITLAQFRAFCDATGLCSTIGGSLVLEFESFCPEGSHTMDFQGWLQCLASQATLLFPRFAPNISRPLLLDVLCTNVLIPWLQTEAATRGHGGNSTQNGSFLEGATPRPHRHRMPLHYDAKELMEEAIGALLATHRSTEMLLHMFALQAADYPAAPAPREGCEFLRCEQLLGIAASAPSSVALFSAPSVLQSLHIGGGCLSALRRVLCARLEEGALRGRFGHASCDATIDACCGWLSIHLPLEAACPPRHILLLLLADALVRIVQASFVSQSEGPLHLWPHNSVSALIFDGSIVPALLDVSAEHWASGAAVVTDETIMRIEATCIGSCMFLALVALLSHELPAMIPSLEDVLAALCDS